MTHPRLRVTVLICCAFLCGIILTSIVIYLKPTERLSHFDPSLGSGTVHFEGFVAPGSENQQELELLAKSGIDVQGPTGIVKPVIIDIKPGEDPPVIDPKNDQSIPVAILSTTQFNAATQVDRTSLTFGRTGGEQSVMSCDSQAQDINGDRLLDLICYFAARLTGFRAADTVGILKGRTVIGTSQIEGKDLIRVAD